MTQTLLAGKGLTQRAHDNGHQLLKPTDFELAAGARVAVTGPSGSGKSVLMRTIALLDLPSSGSIFFRGQSISLEPQNIAHYRSEVAYVRQQPVLLSGSVLDNLMFPYTLQRYRQQKFNKDFIIKSLTQLGKDKDFLQRDGTELSGGEAQLVCLLRVIQLNPPVLLLDEPTASLDETSVRQVQQLVHNWQLSRDDAAYIWVSHSEEQYRAVGDVLWIVENGSISHIESQYSGEQHADNTNSK